MSASLSVSVGGSNLRVPAGTTVATAVAMAGSPAMRTSVSGERRGALCGMGICFECRVTINGQPHQRSCQTVCAEGMEIETT